MLNYNNMLLIHPSCFLLAHSDHAWRHSCYPSGRGAPSSGESHFRIDEAWWLQSIQTWRVTSQLSIASHTQLVLCSFYASVNKYLTLCFNYYLLNYHSLSDLTLSRWYCTRLCAFCINHFTKLLPYILNILHSFTEFHYFLYISSFTWLHDVLRMV